MMGVYIKKETADSLTNRKGFTLVELMVVLFLVVLIIFMAYTLLFSSGNLLKENSDRSDAQSQARRIFQSMQKEIGTASSVQIIGTTDPLAITFPPGTGYLAYFSDGTRFYVMDESISPQPAFGTSEINELNITYTFVDSETLTINIFASNGFDMESTVYSRNVAITKYPDTLTTGNVLMIRSAT